MVKVEVNFFEKRKGCFLNLITFFSDKEPKYAKNKWKKQKNLMVKNTKETYLVLLLHDCPDLQHTFPKKNKKN